MSAFVYLLAEEPHPGEVIAPWTKIGYSKNPPEWRLDANLKRGNPRTLLLKAVFQYENERDARNAERSAHRALANFRGQKEWFQVDWRLAYDWFIDRGDAIRNSEPASKRDEARWLGQ